MRILFLLSRISIAYAIKPINSTLPMLSKADIILAVMDSMGTIVDNLANNFEGEWSNMYRQRDVRDQVITSFINDILDYVDYESMQSIADRFQDRYNALDFPDLDKCLENISQIIIDFELGLYNS
jgi:hypothetical protein